MYGIYKYPYHYRGHKCIGHRHPLELPAGTPSGPLRPPRKRRWLSLWCCWLLWWGLGDVLFEFAGGIVKSFLFDLLVVGVPVTCHRIYKMAIKYMID